ncbi:hypothetical protein Y032_0464g1932 [Ancylostoma ceylanicum]|uniref:Uncharacterized protein n=1 Tax=Ancylostoma ceylanicum TaxID=53326 RepID=A0A016WYJ4_9BILA|nr:hypothetical protein Y032_0464g1932 [Ancylostoma ceylanicum]
MFDLLSICCDLLWNVLEPHLSGCRNPAVVTVGISSYSYDSLVFTCLCCILVLLINCSSTITGQPQHITTFSYLSRSNSAPLP